MAKRGLRTVAVAYKNVEDKKMIGSRKSYHDVIEDIERNGFILLGVFGIEDPPRL